MLGNKKFSGIDLHDDYISCATVQLERGFPVLQNLVKHKLEDELIGGGRVVESDLLKNKLRKSVKEGVISKNVHLAIPTQNTLIRKITSLPDVGVAELKKLLQFHIGESIHLPFDEPIYDFVKLGSIIPKRSGEAWNLEESAETDEGLSLRLPEDSAAKTEGPKSEVLLFATSKVLSQEMADVCMSAGLKPLSAEIRGLALQRLLMYVHPHWLRETEMIIDASEHSVDIHIFKENVIVFSRRMSINLNEFTAVEEKESESDLFVLEDSFLEQFEGHREAAAGKEESGPTNEDAYINEIILEVDRAQNFFRYSLQESESEIKRAIVTGENANKVFGPLRDRIGKPNVVRIDYSSILDPGFKDNELLDSCSAAIGLAMRTNEKYKKK
jgi:type IV pilus assembly protein PilM